MTAVSDVRRAALIMPLSMPAMAAHASVLDAETANTTAAIVRNDLN